MNVVVLSMIVLGGIGLIFGSSLAYAGKKFAVKVDPRVEEVLKVLPGSNCGACGYPGCEGLANAIVEGKAPVTGCVAGGEKVAKAVARIMGIKEDITVVKNVAFLTCQGGKDIAKERFIYEGIKTCKAVDLVQGGPKGCINGCLGFGDCVEACPFSAISMGEDGLPHIDVEKCTGCGLCVKACPRGVLTLLPVNIPLLLGCKTTLPGPDARQVCSKACIGCGICEKSCPKGAIKMQGRLPVIDYNLCDGCGICVEKCPTKALILLKK
ncbi:MAG: electron transporter RnfB [Dictyoglomus sp. NZ13-RE01]|nr:MAG: electron transporter RnfB [Dictyoglomus sp. NZ13-RE01]